MRNEIDDPFEIEERAISHLTTSVRSIKTRPAEDHVRIALVDPSPKKWGWLMPIVLRLTKMMVCLQP
jgi:hypothetical protein